MSSHCLSTRSTVGAVIFAASLLASCGDGGPTPSDSGTMDAAIDAATPPDGSVPGDTGVDAADTPDADRVDAGTECASESDCDDGNACTDDACEAGSCVATPLSVGSCDDGDACTQIDSCSDGVCVGTDPVVCTALDQCHDVGTCDPADGTCSDPESPTGRSCDDGALCTFDDQCDAGTCGGTALVCDDDAAVCGARRSCDGSATCVVSFPGASTSCDDGAMCTHSDVCQGDGTCGGTPISCTDDAGVCGANRACNGTASCTVTYPSSSTSCDDGELCTHTDRCSGSGSCGGTAITCSDSPGTCGANRSCNGTASCTVSYPGASTVCNDGAICTYSDRCTGGGTCRGTTISCTDSPGVCGANRSCNGTSSCSVSYPGSSTTCDDGNACTINDDCNGAGSCGGTSATCTTVLTNSNSGRSCNSICASSGTFPVCIDVGTNNAGTNNRAWDYSPFSCFQRTVGCGSVMGGDGGLTSCMEPVAGGHTHAIDWTHCRCQRR